MAGFGSSNKDPLDKDQTSEAFVHALIKADIEKERANRLKIQAGWSEVKRTKSAIGKTMLTLQMIWRSPDLRGLMWAIIAGVVSGSIVSIISTLLASKPHQ